MRQETERYEGTHVAPTDRERLSSDRSTIGRERRWAWGLTGAVGAAYLVTQLVFFTFDRPAMWDEAVYLSQVTPGQDALFIDAWKSRGLVLLIAPVSLLGGTLDDVRLYLSIASAVGTTAAFGLWIRLIGFAAPIAAFLFSSMWLALSGGSAVYPNLWTAILAVAVCAMVARRVDGGPLRDAVLAVVLLVAMALVRPTEAAALTGAIGVYLLLVRRTSWRFGLALGGALVLGWLPWIVEMSIRFGGLGGALRRGSSAGHLTGARIGQNLVSYFHLPNGRARFASGEIPLQGVVWWSLLLILVGLAVASRERRPGRSAALLPFLGMGALAVAYLVLVPFITARFLLPAYALAAVTAGIGLAWFLRGATFRRVAGILLLASLVPWSLWQLDVGQLILRRQVGPAKVYEGAGLVLKDLADGRPCSFVSPAVYPQVQLASGCSGARIVSRDPTPAQLEAAASGEEVFVILAPPAREDSILGRLTPIRYRSTKRTWYIYRLSQLGPSATPGSPGATAGG